MARPHTGQQAAESGMEALQSGQEMGMEERTEVAAQRYQKHAGLGKQVL
jgi:hypothetical protein